MLQRRFYGAHIEAVRGTHRENRDYIRKEGKWRDSENPRRISQKRLKNPANCQWNPNAA